MAVRVFVNSKDVDLIDQVVEQVGEPADTVAVSMGNGEVVVVANNKAAISAALGLMAREIGLRNVNETIK